MESVSITQTHNLHKLHLTVKNILQAGYFLLEENTDPLTTGRRNFLQLILTKAHQQQDLLRQVPMRLYDATTGRELSNAAHDLRAPLGTVVGFSAMLLDGLDGPLSPLQEQYLQRIYENGNQLLRDLGNLSDYIRLSNDWMIYEPIPVNLHSISNEVIAHILNLKRGIPLPPIHIQIPEDIPLVMSDRNLLRQILTELLENAVKFTTPNGYIMLGAYSAITADQRPVVEICVVDSGYGIAPDDHAFITQPFWQHDEMRVGLGLGLHIAEQLTHLHGGDLWFESEPSRGANFYISLDIA